MPERSEILSEITNYQDIIRRKYLNELSNYTKRDVILYSSAFTAYKKINADIEALSITVKDIPGFMSALHGLKNKKFDLILHTPGGTSEAAEQIVNYLRLKYEHIRAIIPQNAMSAGTMIALACDEIIMGKHSSLGPIDPQISFNFNNKIFTAPAQSLLDEFNEAVQKIIAEPATAPIWVKRISEYPQGFLKVCENAIDRSKSLVKNWLMTWMWKEHPKKERLAQELSDWLNKSDEHKSHSKPVSIQDLINREVKVIYLEDDQDLQELVLSTFHSTLATHEITNCVKIIENQNGKGLFLTVN